MKLEIIESDSNYVATIVKLPELKEVTGLDNLKLATVFGIISMENKELSKAIAIIKQVQQKHVRVCIWLDSSSIFKRDIKLWFENKNGFGLGEVAKPNAK